MFFIGTQCTSVVYSQSSHGDCSGNYSSNIVIVVQ